MGGPRAGEIGGGASGWPRCVKSWVHASEAILAVVRLRTSGSKEADSCRQSPLRRDRQCRDGRPQQVIRRKHPVIPVPVLARLRDQIGEPIQELKRRELDQAVRAGPRGLPPAARADAVGGLAPGHRVADATVGTADHGEPF